jgi:lipoprotein signal peptidase
MNQPAANNEAEVTLPPPVAKPIGIPWTIITALVFVVLDLWTKRTIFIAVPPAEPYDPRVHLFQLTQVWSEYSWLEPHWNTGTAWSMFSSVPGIVTIITLILIPAIIWYWYASFRHQRAPSLAMGGIIGGALGNAWDRVLAQLDTPGIMGVRDFIHIDLNMVGIDYTWPTFNIADMGITGGAIVLIAHQLFFAPAADRNVHSPN